MSRQPNWNQALLVHAAKITNLRHDCYFITTNDTVVWKDTPNESAITATYKSDESIATTIPFEQADHISWTTIEIAPRFEARIKGTNDVKMGSTPAEAVRHLQFPEEYELDREPITSAETFQEQLEDILSYHNGAVHVETVETFLNPNTLTEPVPQSTTDKMLELEDKTNIYRTRGKNPNWWTVR